jgi:uncharacterized protein YjbI with pentapeptide repeats
VPEKEKKKALVIGVSEYDKLRSLKFCENDGKQMVSVLTSTPLAYEITELIGTVNWSVLKNAINTFFLSEELKPTDTLLFYFSGHGIMDKFGRYYLAPSEIDPTDPIDTKNKGFSFDDLQENIDYTLSRRVVTVLDCCYSGAAKLDDKRIGKGVSEEAAKIATQVIKKKMKSGKGKSILSACLDFQEAEKAADKEYSIFTYYLLAGLKGYDNEYINKYGNVTISLLGNYIYDKVTNHEPKSERPKQIPIVKTELSDDTVLAHYPDKVKQEKEVNENEILLKLLQQGKIAEFNKKREEDPYQSIDLHEANLAKADLRGANLEGVNLAKANLKGADLMRANLWRANLKEAKLELDEFKRANLCGAYLKGANVVYANLENANLEKANLWRANLENANLRKANLCGAYLMEANLLGADLEGAKLEGADLRQTKNLPISKDEARERGAII